MLCIRRRWYQRLTKVNTPMTYLYETIPPRKGAKVKQFEIK